MVESSTRLRGARALFDPPQPGDRFVVAEPPGIMTVEVCHLGVSENDGSIRYLVRASDAPAGFSLRAEPMMTPCGGSERR